MWFNDILSTLLKSPLHGLMSASTVLITVTGKRRGRHFTMPVNFVQLGETLLIMSRADCTWWRNLIPDAPIQVVLRGRERTGTGRAIQDAAQVAQHLRRFLEERPAWAVRFGVSRDANGSLNAEALMREARERVAIEVKLAGKT